MGRLQELAKHWDLLVNKVVKELGGSLRFFDRFLTGDLRLDRVFQRLKEGIRNFPKKVDITIHYGVILHADSSLVPHLKGLFISLLRVRSYWNILVAIQIYIYFIDCSTTTNV